MEPLFNEDEGEKDSRSDDKGVEPEALAVGTIDGYTYAFIGFERQNAIVVYDITDPFSPLFVTYYNNRTIGADGIAGDISPEIITFVPPQKAPMEKTCWWWVTKSAEVSASYRWAANW
ncbi:MAG: hypothetical protein H6559_28100 [Lewinellaceae bacterium]|nr:hypothetical protein [Lewinellaceae bacterium]